MFADLMFITDFVFSNFVRIWPYLLITIPLAVGVQLSGASKYIRRALGAKPMVAILLATLVGAFSPFCSCTVIPIVAAMLIGGVPLAPVMSFWIASPSMDPETFFLSVAMIGWDMAIWRLAATIVLSLGAGYITQFAMNRTWLGDRILRDQTKSAPKAWPAIREWLVAAYRAMTDWHPQRLRPAYSAPIASGGAMPLPSADTTAPVCSTGSGHAPCSMEDDSASSTCDSGCAVESEPFRARLLRETWSATSLVVRFMLMAFVLEALIIRFVPAGWISGLLGHQNPFAIPLAALIGVPVYTSNLAALPMVSGLLAQGMNPAAGLAFLIAGPTTTLPAMTAVWQLTSRRVFGLYVAFALVGAVVTGTIYQIVQWVW